MSRHPAAFQMKFARQVGNASILSLSIEEVCQLSVASKLPARKFACSKWRKKLEKFLSWPDTSFPMFFEFPTTSFVVSPSFFELQTKRWAKTSNLNCFCVLPPRLPQIRAAACRPEPWDEYTLTKASQGSFTTADNPSPGSLSPLPQSAKSTRLLPRKMILAYFHCDRRGYLLCCFALRLTFRPLAEDLRRQFFWQTAEADSITGDKFPFDQLPAELQSHVLRFTPILWLFEGLDRVSTKMNRMIYSSITELQSQLPIPLVLRMSHRFTSLRSWQIVGAAELALTKSQWIFLGEHIRDKRIACFPALETLLWEEPFLKEGPHLHLRTVLKEIVSRVSPQLIRLTCPCEVLYRVPAFPLLEELTLVRDSDSVFIPELPHIAPRLRCLSSASGVGAITTSDIIAAKLEDFQFLQAVNLSLVQAPTERGIGYLKEIVDYARINTHLQEITLHGGYLGVPSKYISTIRAAVDGEQDERIRSVLLNATIGIETRSRRVIDCIMVNGDLVTLHWWLQQAESDLTNLVFRHKRTSLYSVIGSVLVMSPPEQSIARLCMDYVTSDVVEQAVKRGLELDPLFFAAVIRLSCEDILNKLIQLGVSFDIPFMAGCNPTVARSIVLGMQADPSKCLPIVCKVLSRAPKFGICYSLAKLAGDPPLLESVFQAWAPQLKKFLQDPTVNAFILSRLTGYETERPDTLVAYGLDNLFLMLHRWGFDINCRYPISTQSPLMLYVDTLSVDILEAALKIPGVDVNITNHYGSTPLGRATSHLPDDTKYERAKVMVKLLVHHGADLEHRNKRGLPMLQLLLGNPKRSIQDWFLEIFPGDYLHYGILKALSTVQVLQQEILRRILRNVDMIRNDSVFADWLVVAAMKGNVEVVRVMLETVSVHALGHLSSLSAPLAATALITKPGPEFDEIVDLIGKAAPDKRTVFSSYSHRRNSCLMLALRHCTEVYADQWTLSMDEFKERITLLCSYGAHTHCEGSDTSPLHLAVMLPTVDMAKWMIEFLSEHGADFGASSDHTQAIELANRIGRPEIARLVQDKVSAKG